MKSMNDLSNLSFAMLVLQEKRNRLQDPRSPLGQKLRLAIDELQYLETRENSAPKNWWYIQCLDGNAQHIGALDLTESERQRIAALIVQGYTAGEIHGGAYRKEQKGESK